MSTALRVAATAAVVLGGSLFTAPTSSAAPLMDGLYRLNFPAGQPLFDSTTPSGEWSWALAIRSACTASGCVATATQVGADGATYVFRQSGGRWISSKSQGFACQSKKTAGTSTLSFTRSGDSSLTGDRTESASPCTPVTQTFTGFRDGDIPAGVTVADPNTV